MIPTVRVSCSPATVGYYAGVQTDRRIAVVSEGCKSNCTDNDII